MVLIMFLTAQTAEHNVIQRLNYVGYRPAIEDPRTIILSNCCSKIKSIDITTGITKVVIKKSSTRG